MLAPRVRLRGVKTPRVEKLRRREDVQGLLRALQYHDETLPDGGAGVRRDAVLGLMPLDASEIHAALSRAVSDPAEIVQTAAIVALRDRGGVQAIEPLVAAVVNLPPDRSPRALEAAVAALEVVGDPDVPLRVAGALVARQSELEDQEHVILRRLAFAADEAGGVALTISYLVSILGEPERGLQAIPLLVALAPQSVDPLIAALNEERQSEHAAVALGYTHDSEGVEPLCHLLLRSDDPALRRAAAWALGEIRDPAATEALLLATSDADHDVRTEAGAAFDQFGNAGLALTLSSLLAPALGAGPQGAPDTDDQQAADAPPSAPSTPSAAISRGSHGGAEGAEAVLRRLLRRRGERRAPGSDQ
jgi:HEAT repeat protein